VVFVRCDSSSAPGAGAGELELRHTADCNHTEIRGARQVGRGGRVWPRSGPLAYQVRANSGKRSASAMMMMRRSWISYA
jgi:hypothetical protein